MHAALSFDAQHVGHGVENARRGRLVRTTRGGEGPERGAEDEERTGGGRGEQAGRTGQTSKPTELDNNATHSTNGLRVGDSRKSALGRKRGREGESELLRESE